MREYLTRALERSGYEVVAVDRGTAALPLLERGALICCSPISLCPNDGIELARHLQFGSPVNLKSCSSPIFRRCPSCR